MAEDTEDKHSKTEDPTPRKLKKAREQGDVPSSKEAGTAMTFLVMLALTLLLLPTVIPPLVGVLSRVIQASGTATIGEEMAGLRDIALVAGPLMGGIGTVMAPVLGALIVSALVAVAIQGDTVVAAERIRPKLSKLDPLQGLKRMFSLDSLVEFAKSVLKVLVVGSVAVWISYHAVAGIWQSESFLPEFIVGYLQHYVALLLGIAAVFATAVALADIIYKRMRWMAKQRMTIKEVRDELKESEGNPLIKGKRMEIRRRRARQRLRQAVPEATVVLTNPTHYAVVLRYEPGEDMAPICTAKGADLMAAQIRKLAHDSEVPVVENRPLARALFDVAEIDKAIPTEHWQAVAEIIRYILDLRDNISRDAPAGSSLRDD